jgi:hypothetical protein
LIGAAVSVPLAWPVIQARLVGFYSTSGLPVSWTNRLYNLRSYFWPQLFSGHHYLLGVRPAARVPDPHRQFGYIWIESGYTWLLWAGGIPLLLAFIWFVAVTMRAGWRGARTGTEPIRVAAVATCVAVSVTAVTMVFDPHLTYRGSADELFVLLGLVAAAGRAGARLHHPTTPHRLEEVR